ncbi:MAG TPA: bacteriocin class II family protein, partial [Candidatus Eremiobacteraeota bacterium]|nr:bacteriocin class II family protein [Candidatus Eremiobacteraeota bacterium]
YHEHPEDLKLKCPEKFKRIQEMEKNGFFDKLLDQKAFRETGKYMGQIMEKVPYLQNGLAMVSFISGLVQAFKGLGDMKRAEKTGDHRLAMNATMNFTAGSCFASKLFCIVGMGIEGAKSELNRAIDKKEITPEQANAVVQTTVGCIAGPVGHAINWVISRLPWNKTCEITSNSIEVLSEKLSEVKMDIISSLSNKELTRKELKHFLKQAGFTGTEIEMINETTERYCNVNYVINNSNLQCLAGKLSAEKLNYLKMISNKEYTKEELKNLLLKASFKKEEIGIIMEVTEKERKFFNSFRGRRITDNTINNLKDKLSAHKLDFLSGMRDKELTNKDLLKVLRKMNFTNEEIALVKVCAEYVENVNSQTENIGSLKKASGIAIGGATGGMAGGFIGPYLGVMGGFALAGPVGGVLGLMAGAIAGVYAGRRIGGEVGKAVGGVLDKFCEQ